MYRALVASLAICASGLFASSALAENVNPYTGTFVSSGSPNRNYYGIEPLAIDGTPTVRSLLAFDTGGSTSSVTSATLTINVLSGQGSTQTANLRAVSCDWDPNTVTYNTSLPVGTILSSNTTPAGNTTFTVPASYINNDADHKVCFYIAKGGSSEVGFWGPNGTVKPVLALTRSTTPPPPPPPPPPGGDFAGLTPTKMVTATGSDANSCSTSAPCATLGRANQVAQPGDVIGVGDGNYSGAALTAGGTASAPIRYASQHRYGAHLTSQTNVSAPYVELYNFDVGGYAGGAFALDGSYDKAVGNKIHDLTFTCGQITAAIWAADGNDSPVYSSHDQEVRGNYLINIGQGARDGSCGSSQGIYASVANVKIINNVVVRALADGISSWHAATHLTIVNNTVVDNGAGGVLIGCGDSGCTSSNSGSYVANNIAYRNCIGGFYESGSVTSPTYVNNLAYANAPSRCRQDLTANTYVQGGSGWIFADPLFANIAGDDYHLQAGSPAVDSGTATGAPSSDIDGTVRPTGAGFDRGAYER
jgi:hypothetical protein